MCKFTLTMLEGTRALLAAHRRELPQRDDLCGAFCTALALRAADVQRRGGEALDQDAVALAAGTLVSAAADPARPPAGETGRRGHPPHPPPHQDAAPPGTHPP